MWNEAVMEQLCLKGREEGRLVQREVFYPPKGKEAIVKPKMVFPFVSRINICSLVWTDKQNGDSRCKVPGCHLSSSALFTRSYGVPMSQPSQMVPDGVLGKIFESKSCLPSPPSLPEDRCKMEPVIRG